MSGTGRAAPGGWRRALRGAGIAGGAVSAVAAAVYAAQRAVVANDRSRPDPDAGTALRPRFDEARRVPSHDGGGIHTISAGSGPTLVLSHGVTLSSRLWVKQFDHLPVRGLRVVAYDHRGHGESEPGESGHTLANLAADVRTVLEELDLRDVVLVGHSMGGVAVMAFAIEHPDVAAARVHGLVLMSTLATTHVSLSRRLRCGLQQAWDRGPDIVGLMRQRNLGFLLARIGFGRDPQPSHVEMTREMIAATTHESSRPAISVLLALDLTGDLSKIVLPTLVLSGSADLIAPPAESRRIAELIPGARLEVFEGAGHMLMLERTEEVDDLLADFVREVGAREPGVEASASRRWPRRRVAGRRRGPLARRRTPRRTE